MSTLEPVHRRPWTHHAVVIAVATVGVAMLEWADVVPAVPLPVFVAAMVGSAVAGTAAYRVWPGDVLGWRRHARILAHVVPVAVLTYLTGWGAALVPVQLVAVAGNVRHGGYRTLRPALAWAAVLTALLEVGVHLQLVATNQTVAASHGLAAVGAGAVAFIGFEFAAADRERRRAEQRQAVLEVDVDESRLAHDRLRAEADWRAHHDPVTRLPQRDELLELQLHEPGVDASPWLLLVRLEGLPAATGLTATRRADLVVRTAADRIVSRAQPHARTVARVGREDFAVVIDVQEAGLRPALAAERVAAGIAAAVRVPVPTPDGALHMTACIGIAALGRGTTVEEGLDRATTALHAARAQGVDHVERYDGSAHVAVADRLVLAGEIRSGVVNQDFDLDYQPIVDLRSGAVVGAEALVRWDHATRGRLGPDAFIPEAERTGHIKQIGRYVLEEAAWQARLWERELGDAAPTVAVNVSARQLDAHLVEVVEEILDDTLLSPDRLTLELTETSIAPGGAQALQRRLRELKDLGVMLALDDFGTGYSSLEYLEQLPVDILKIDRVFVERAVTGHGSVAKAIVDLAHAMGLVTVIEGIETQQQADLFVRLGCERAQGYLFAPPLPAVLLTHQLRSGPVVLAEAAASWVTPPGATRRSAPC